MQNKIGRPKIDKETAKSVLIGARFSDTESKEVHDAIKQSKQVKSTWIRNALLDHARNGK